MATVSLWLLVVGASLSLAGPAMGQTSAASGRAPAVPRMLDGKPDFSGIWQALNTAAVDIQDHSAAKGTAAGQGVVEGGDIPYQPWALAKKRDNFSNRQTADPLSQCYQPGVPRVMYLPFPIQILQTPDYISVVSEYTHGVRHLYMNSPHPRGPIEWWMGDSRGHWEGDALIVDVRHFGPSNWFDQAGNFHSDALHLAERYTLLDADHLTYEVMVEDATVFTRPWKMSMLLYRHVEPDFQILDYECHSFHSESDRDASISKGR